MTRDDDTRVYSPEELERMIGQMKAASGAFYFLATRIGNHPFIEFTGLMNEYIKICEQTLKAGGDFSTANTHTGGALVFHDYNLKYLMEKLDCIYGPSIAALLQSRLTGKKTHLPKSRYERAQLRPANFSSMTPAEQWAVDKDLGILDWDGSDDRVDAGPMMHYSV